MRLPTLSVIMGNYNHAHYLTQSIPAILNQSVRPKEFIIIDDASTDNSVEIIEEFAKKDNVIRFIKNEKNMGNNPTFYKGMALMTGDYFIAAAADDLVLPGLFEKSMTMLAKYPNAGFCSSISRRVDGNGNELVTAPEPPYISKVPCYIPPEKALELFLRQEGDLFMASTAIWKVQAIKEMGAFSRSMDKFADIFTVPLIALNYGACFIPELLGLYRVLENSFSKGARENPKFFFDMMEKVIEGMESKNYYDKFPPAFIDSFHKLALYQTGTIALKNLNIATNECYGFLEKSLSNTSLLNRIILSVNRSLLKFPNALMRLLLYFRLRNISWFMIRRIFLRYKRNENED